jgi:hypothetical protein
LSRLITCIQTSRRSQLGGGRAFANNNIRKRPITCLGRCDSLPSLAWLRP